MVREASGATIDRFYHCPYDPEGKIKAYREIIPGENPIRGC